MGISVVVHRLGTPVTSIDWEVKVMRDVFAIWVVIVLVLLFFFSLFSLAESGYSNLFITVLSGFCLFRILRHMHKVSQINAAREKRSSGGCGADEPPGPLEYIVFYDLTDDIDEQSWDDD